ncbi:MAG: hypothetical protein QOC59_350, partial [Microbacteriaceae bacterium]|nr:hypothetical protein [Microbacteriaceae bacterium]
MADPQPVPPRRTARGAATVLTVLAVLVVWSALLIPDRLDRLAPAAFLRIPAEGLILVALAIVLPPLPRRILAVTAGVLLGLLTVLKVLNAGFFEELRRPFDPVSDWRQLGPAVGVLQDSVGPAGAVAAAVGALLLIVALPVVVTVSVNRITRVAASHRAGSARVSAAFGTAWVLSAVLGLAAAPGVPVASVGAAAFASHEAAAIGGSVRDLALFRGELSATDRYGRTPSTDLLRGLAGKDVLLVFVESYGQVAVQGSSFAPGVDAALDRDTRALKAAGFASRSAFLTSPTFGGVSWLAHSTLQSGVWVPDQQRYDQLLASRRTTLTSAFSRAGWQTVSDVPSDTRPWPQGARFYGFDRLYGAGDVGYAGPRFSYARIPDQYTLAAFQRRELQPHHAPVMAEIDLVSSHTPWTPLPRVVDWDAVGDGSVYDGMPGQGLTPDVAWRDPERVRALYAQSIRYSIDVLTEFVARSHDPDLVVVMLGDHPPARIVSGPRATHAVPVSILASDPAVLDRISSWGWTDGLRPGP